MNRIYFAIAFLAALCAPAVSARELSTVDDYASRLDLAERTVDEALEREISAPELVDMMNAVKRLLPASEEVEFNGSIIRVDNAWLHEAANNVAKNAGASVEKRHSMLSEISTRLARLRQSVRSAQTDRDRKLQDQRERLDSILARPEYQPEKERESVIGRWLRRIKEFIVELLMKVFGGSSVRQSQPGGAGLVAFLRLLVALAVLAALIYGAASLAKRFQPRKRPAKGDEPREVLGEEIAEDATAADLFAMASELARRGEYRKAIRRAYIALLCDLERRGKLRLGRSMTNRDYLNAIRSDRGIYPTFSLMTEAFERAWYGQARATEEEFRNFVALYQEAVK